jgi:AAA15 family ATPase/GTPase
MILKRVALKNFKRFDTLEFDLPGHTVIAGPNNMGKTTLLQAIAAWDLTFRTWQGLNSKHKAGGYYEYAPIARQAFSAVPLRRFDLLWSERKTSGPIEIGLEFDSGFSISMEIKHDSTEQIKVRPSKDVDYYSAKLFDVRTVFVPPMSGLLPEEPLYAIPAFIDARLAQGRPGEVLRNLLVAAHQGSAWQPLQQAIKRLFNYELLPPAVGANIVAEYTRPGTTATYDIASAGSGFLQVLMLLTFLHTRPGSILLLDEPDAHLHVILQDAIYGELRSVAAANGSQLLIATHSEVIIESVDPRELCLMYGKPKLLSTTEERAKLIQSLGVLTHTDIMLAENAPGVFYVDDYTDMDVLRAWARVLNHKVESLLTTELLWKARVIQQRDGASGIQAKDHFDALQLVRPGLPGLQLLDGDAHQGQKQCLTYAGGLQRLRWEWYEIESYLVDPRGLDRFVTQQVGAPNATAAIADLRAEMERMFRKEFLQDPMNPEPLVASFLRTTKARKDILPALLQAAGLHNIPYTRYHEIAALMRPDEIPIEVIEKLDDICRVFGVEP